MAVRGLTILALLASAIVSSQAQSTWGDLRFGMSAEEAKEKLSGQSLELKPTDGKPGTFTVTQGYTLETHGVIKTMNFLVEVDFGKSGLSHIGLKLDQAKTLDGTIANNVMLVTELPEEINNLLSTKYGKPVDRQGSCDNSIQTILAPVMQNIITCESTWGDKGQQIKASWQYSSIFHPVQVPVPGKNKTKRELKKDETFGYQIDYRPQSVGL